MATIEELRKAFDSASVAPKANEMGQLVLEEIQLEILSAIQVHVAHYASINGKEFDRVKDLLVGFSVDLKKEPNGEYNLKIIDQFGKTTPIYRESERRDPVFAALADIIMKNGFTGRSGYHEISFIESIGKVLQIAGKLYNDLLKDVDYKPKGVLAELIKDPEYTSTPQAAHAHISGVLGEIKEAAEKGGPNR